MGKRARKNDHINVAKRKKILEEQDKLLNSSWNALDDIEDKEYSGSDWDNEEQDYELRPRKLVQKDEVAEALPIITADGKIQRVSKAPRKPKKVEEEKEESESEVEEDDDEEENNDDDESDNEENDKIFDFQDISEKALTATKEEIASLAELLFSDSENSISSLTKIRKMASTKNIKIKRIVFLSLIPIFKGLIPGYKIKPLTPLEEKEKASKEVKLRRNFEQSLALNYKAYIDLLSETYHNCIKTQCEKGDDNINLLLLSNTTISVACELLSNFSQFNFANDLISLIVRKLGRRSQIDKTFWKCVSTFENLLKDDLTGEVSFDILRQTTKMFRNLNYKINENVVTIFLSLNILTDYDPNKIEEEESQKPKMKKKDRVHLSKKQRKARKEQKKIDEEINKADTIVSAETLDRYQGEILKMLMITYLNILKGRNSDLIGAALEGLVKFGHKANADMLGDLLEVLRELTGELDIGDNNETVLRQTLLCIVTAFSLITGQAHYKVPVDLTSFVVKLYDILYIVSIDADVELSRKSLRLDDPLEDNSAKKRRRLFNVSTKTELVLKALERIFFSGHTTNKLRVEAFTKKLYTCLLQLPEKSDIAVLRFFEQMMARYPVIGGLYSTEDRIANGSYLMEASHPEQSNPEAAMIWETVLLEKHYSPTVVKLSRQLAKSTNIN